MSFCQLLLILLLISVTWLRKKEVLEDEQVYHFDKFEDTYCLEIIDTELDDADTYTCLAQNTQGQASVEIPLIVNGMCDFWV